jgi:hypothetical protein
MTKDWQLVLAPWKPGGRTYTYLLPPLLSHLVEGDMLMVETPKGDAMFIEIAEVTTLEPMPFPTKPVAGGWSRDEYDAVKEEGGTFSAWAEYPEWIGIAARFNAGEDINAKQE